MSSIQIPQFAAEDLVNPLFVSNKPAFAGYVALTGGEVTSQVLRADTLSGDFALESDFTLTTFEIVAIGARLSVGAFREISEPHQEVARPQIEYSPLGFKATFWGKEALEDHTVEVFVTAVGQ